MTEEEDSMENLVSMTSISLRYRAGFWPFGDQARKDGLILRTPKLFKIGLLKKLSLS